ncbi:MAG: division/cell wall cluster transcriptional repressor MraZ [Myxococcales bacterium]|jgi:MraZ protein|nr:division/cell wall cluster transcriptional repressor MraZ [Myxococcales bacterium]
MFLGNFEHTIDVKGRTSVPADYRKLLSEDRIVVTPAPGDDRCLHVYPLNAWQDFATKLAQRSSSEPGVRQIYRTYVAQAAAIEIDKLGRILLPPKLRQWAGLEKDVVWVGQLNRMELWEPERWEQVELAANDPVHQGDVDRVKIELGL